MMSDQRESGDGQETTSNNQSSSNKQLLNWQPNTEYLNSLLEMGISLNAARKALFYTNNHSVLEATSWIFDCKDNNLKLNLETPIEEDLDLSLISNLCSQVNIGDLDKNEYKVVYVVNSSLNMGLGKICSQVAHATLSIFFEMNGEPTKTYLTWLNNGQTKIVLKGTSTQQLIYLNEKAKNAGLKSILIRDAGRTQIASGSTTVCAIYGKVESVDLITGNLQLL